MEHSRREAIGAALILVATVVIMINQAVVIADVGVAGWLQGDGPSQSEWEVRASLGAIGLLVAAVVALVVRATEGIAVAWKDRRLLRAILKELRRRSEERDRI